MPQDFKCTACSLHFSVGQYHYHGFQDGYVGRTLLVCRECGTQHAMEHAARDRGPETYPLLKVVVHAASVEARSLIARRWLRQERKLSLTDALALVRAMPLVLFESTHAHVAEAVTRELQPFDVDLRITAVGAVKNSGYGPLQTDRLLHATGPRWTKGRTEWLPVDGGNVVMQCTHCAGQDTLADEVSSSDPCPGCKQRSLRLEGEWIT